MGFIRVGGGGGGADDGFPRTLSMRVIVNNLSILLLLLLPYVRGWVLTRRYNYCGFGEGGVRGKGVGKGWGRGVDGGRFLQLHHAGHCQHRRQHEHLAVVLAVVCDGVGLTTGLTVILEKEAGAGDGEGA